MNDDFYVGYLPQAPEALGRFIRRVVIGLVVLAGATALVLVWAQERFAASAFEYGTVREFSGTIEAHPYPTLLVPRPAPATTASRYLLIAPGKNGADSLVAGLDGKYVHLKGQLIYRDGQTMVEVVPGTVALAAEPAAPQQQREEMGKVILRGEIVDSKCYLGVMNPGSGKVHRDCAVRCISGGAPPLFVGEERGDVFVLADSGGGAIPRDELKPFIGEPITVHGAMEQRGDQLFLKIDTHTLQHTPDRVESAWACPRSR